jgi:sulfate adenylyltransferase subunit 2
MTDTLHFLVGNTPKAWTTRSISMHLWSSEQPSDLKKTERWLSKHNLNYPAIDNSSLSDEHERPAKHIVLSNLLKLGRQKRKTILYAALYPLDKNLSVLYANDGRQGKRWSFISQGKPTASQLTDALKGLADLEDKDLIILPSGTLVGVCREIVRHLRGNNLACEKNSLRLALEIYSHGRSEITSYVNEAQRFMPESNMSHLDRLEAESIHIIREVIAEADNPVMLYSVGKVSSVMLHLARKAFYPSPPPFPLLHVDTRWKFQAMYDFRDYMAESSGMDLLIHTNPEGIEKDINPLDHGSALHTDIMKTQGLKQALENYKFDAAFGGARRDEEKSRAKERVFSFRTRTQRWDPKNQRPEIWHQYNGKKSIGESIRVFPLSNWTELDIWQYIYREQIPIVPLYFAAERPVVERDGMLLMVDDDRFKLYPDEQIMIKKVRFRTLGCYPLTGAIESEADDLASIVLELLKAKTSERQGRAIDSDTSASMEKKKQEGYF